MAGGIEPGRAFAPGADSDAAISFLRYLVSLSHLQDIYYLWRPFLRDPDDDMVLECAVTAGCAYIVTHNIKEFRRTEQLGVRAIDPAEFLQFLKDKSP